MMPPATQECTGTDVRLFELTQDLVRAESAYASCLQKADELQEIQCSLDRLCARACHDIILSRRHRKHVESDYYSRVSKILRPNQYRLSFFLDYTKNRNKGVLRGCIKAVLEHCLIRENDAIRLLEIPLAVILTSFNYILDKLNKTSLQTGYRWLVIPLVDDMTTSVDSDIVCGQIGHTLRGCLSDFLDDIYRSCDSDQFNAKVFSDIDSRSLFYVCQIKSSRVSDWLQTSKRVLEPYKGAVVIYGSFFVTNGRSRVEPYDLDVTTVSVETASVDNRLVNIMLSTLTIQGIRNFLIHFYDSRVVSFSMGSRSQWLFLRYVNKYSGVPYSTFESAIAYEVAKFDTSLIVSQGFGCDRDIEMSMSTLWFSVMTNLIAGLTPVDKASMVLSLGSGYIQMEGEEFFELLQQALLDFRGARVSRGDNEDRVIEATLALPEAGGSGRVQAV